MGGGVSIDALITKGLTEGWHQALIGLAIAFLGVLAKDHNVSGTTQKTSEDPPQDHGNGGSSNPGGPRTP